MTASLINFRVADDTPGNPAHPFGERTISRNSPVDVGNESRPHSALKFTVMDMTHKPTPALKIEVTQQVQPDSRDVIAHGLRAFNASHLGNYLWADLDVYVRDLDGEVVGGLIGDMALGWLAVHALWVKEDLRGSGVGTEILSTAENAAIKNSCRAVILDTLSFQSPSFYEKRGYIRVGIVDDYRGGAQRIFMQKLLGLGSTLAGTE